ncbi:oxygen tolerance protein BatD [Sinobacterium caligoides]|uniref:Oxygen tolerance protein BatD n=1 Tax=Sinobacterium caligoides TaxID=933926 RepID=A0A3N2DYR5_9GAMM|nr:BatD family protein [Sinobacterium caligoides]ROS05006.1 oxygen tolerance protein BatD [Sinobacterium caligoides]
MRIFHLLTARHGATLLKATLLWLFCFSSAWAATTASVDRNPVAIDETFLLTISSDEAGFFDSSPDFSALNHQFNILSTSQQTSSVNGDTTRSWSLTLSPKTQGKVSIPAIEVADQKTQPIVMNILSVKQAPRGGSSNSNNQLYVEASADQNTVYKGAEFIYTVRVYASIQLARGSELNQPDFADATVKELDNNQFQKRINGVAYTILERRYAVFPQSTGELEIAPAVLKARVPYGRSSVFGQSQVRTVTRRSEMTTVNVIDPPESFQGANWLPASQLTLQQQWSKDPKQLMVGDSITRTIQQQASGLIAIQLAPIQEPKIDGLKFYADKPKLEDSATATGSVATRSDSYAIIATRAGSFTLPAIDISWWNTSSNRLEHATLPATTVVVAANPDQAITTIAPTAPNNNLQAPAPTSIRGDTPPPAQQTGTTLWQISTGLFALLWLATLAYCFKLRRPPSSMATTPPSNKADANEKDAYAELKSACDNNDARQAESTLLSWGKTFYPGASISSVSDILLASQSEPLKHAWQQLQNNIYRDDSTTWQGDSLLSAIDNCRNATSKNEEELASLYPR